MCSQPQSCWLRLPAQPGHHSQGRHSSACCPECFCPLENPKGFHRKIIQSGIYSPTPLWAPGFLPASSFPTARSTYDRNSARLKLESTNSGAVDMGGRHRQSCVQERGRGWAGPQRGLTGRHKAGKTSLQPSRLRREGQGKDRRESWGLGLGSITAAEPGSLVQNRSGLRLSIHLELKGNRRRTVKCTGQSYF